MANNPPVLVDALLATIASLRDSLVAANVHAAKMERDTHKDRASIVAFLTAETNRIDDAAERVDDEDHGVTGKRLRAQASIGRTWTAQIERGDDRNGADACGAIERERRIAEHYRHEREGQAAFRRHFVAVVREGVTPEIYQAWCREAERRGLAGDP